VTRCLGPLVSASARPTFTGPSAPGPEPETSWPSVPSSRPVHEPGNARRMCGGISITDECCQVEGGRSLQHEH
jgi:hypothetical protein